MEQLRGHQAKCHVQLLHDATSEHAQFQKNGESSNLLRYRQVLLDCFR